jgi:hypothetical protein
MTTCVYFWYLTVVSLCKLRLFWEGHFGLEVILIAADYFLWSVNWSWRKSWAWIMFCAMSWLIVNLLVRCGEILERVKMLVFFRTVHNFNIYVQWQNKCPRSCIFVLIVIVTVHRWLIKLFLYTLVRSIAVSVQHFVNHWCVPRK